MEEEGEGGERERGKATVLGGREEREEGVKGESLRGAGRARKKGERGRGRAEVGVGGGAVGSLSEFSISAPKGGGLVTVRKLRRPSDLCRVTTLPRPRPRFEFKGPCDSDEIESDCVRT